MKIQSNSTTLIPSYSSAQSNDIHFKEVQLSSAVISENMKEAKSSDIREDLSSKYDVRKATVKEITEISQALYRAGETSLKEVVILIFDYEGGNE
ncbi:hypothetical protein [Metabacillus fastidiosus]|uniref:hypothetical protein n=1 Tax=Metabacillus fastidiosus TaxID=1458 RepID=UPI003D2BD565